MATPDLEPTTVESFGDHLQGNVLRPGDEGYDEARTVWNAMIDKEPAVIVQCTGAADVIAAVNFARDLDLPLAVKGGGHNVSGLAVCDDGMAIDLSPMNAVRVDPEAQIARVQAGATMADLDHETQAYGLATTGGIVSTTGVAGLTLGGGLGRLDRKFGLAIDNLLSVDVVTAEGELVHANETENPDLFWGLRGGGGNFGVVTSFEFQLHEIGPDVLAGRLIYPVEAAADVLSFYRDFMTEAPDGVQCYAAFVQVPPLPEFPEPIHGQMVFILIPFYAGDIEQGTEILQPLRDVGDPIADTVRPQPYTVFQSGSDEIYQEGHRNYWKSHYLGGLSDEAIDTMVEYATPIPTPFTTVFLEWMGGAIGRVDADATAFPHRDATLSFTVAPKWSDPELDDDLIEWAREFHEGMTPYASEGVYANYLDRDEGDRVKTAYGENFDRLVEVKNEWDPENLFQMNQNIEPSV
ncbi:MAG: FAD-binding oxidoreductase [Natronomonas sp.]